MAMGRIVDRFSDILTISTRLLQPASDIGLSSPTECSDGVLAQPDGMICLHNLERMFEHNDTTTTSHSYP